MYVALLLSVPLRGRTEVRALNFKDFSFITPDYLPDDGSPLPNTDNIMIYRRSSSMKQFSGGLDQRGELPADVLIFSNDTFPILSFPEAYKDYEKYRWVVFAGILPH